MTTPSPSRRPRVPALLDDAAGWTWRVLVLAVAVYLLGKVAGRLEIVVIPVLASLLLAALLEPISRFLRRMHLPTSLSAVLTVVVALAVLGGIGTFVVNRAIAGYPDLVNNVGDLVTRGQHYLETGPLKIKFSAGSDPATSVKDFLNGRRSEIASGAVEAGKTAVDVTTALVLTLFLTIFVLYDGRRIWLWLTGLVPTSSRARTDRVGEQMWSTLSGYVSGTFLVALFHGVVIGITLAATGVPLVAPLAVLVFIGGFIPLIGAVVFGGLAVLVALIAKGTTAGLVVLIVLVVENQVESHVLQPFVVGRHVSLHPAAIALTLASGAVLAGLPGAIFAVPIVASLNAAGKALREPPPPETSLPSAQAVEEHMDPAADREDAGNEVREHHGVVHHADKDDAEASTPTTSPATSPTISPATSPAAEQPVTRVGPADLPFASYLGQTGGQGGHDQRDVEG